AASALVLGVLATTALVSTGRLELGGRPTVASDQAVGAGMAPRRPADRVGGSATRPESVPVAPVPHRLVVTSQPAGAELRILWPDGSAKASRTPFRGTVLGGRLRLTLARPGFNRLT